MRPRRGPFSRRCRARAAVEDCGRGRGAVPAFAKRFGRQAGDRPQQGWWAHRRDAESTEATWRLCSEAKAAVVVVAQASCLSVIPAQAGIQYVNPASLLVSRLRGNDGGRPATMRAPKGRQQDSPGQRPGNTGTVDCRALKGRNTGVKVRQTRPSRQDVTPLQGYLSGCMFSQGVALGCYVSGLRPASRAPACVSPRPAELGRPAPRYRGQDAPASMLPRGEGGKLRFRFSLLRSRFRTWRRCSRAG